MNNNLSKKRRVTTGMIVGAVVGAISASLMGWLRSEFGFDFLTRLLIVVIVSIIVGGITYLILRKK